MLRSKERPIPGPTYMSDEQKAQYLDDLRSNRLSRPSGSRPLPPSKFSALKRSDTEANVTAPIHEYRPSLPSSNSMPMMPAQSTSHAREDSIGRSRSPFAGRPLARPPSAQPSEEEESPVVPEDVPMPRRPSMQYIERGTRWMEKQEVRSLRMALEDMDLGEEKKVHAAAQDEAAELVWKHRNPGAITALAEAPYPNPDVRRDYRSHLRKGSYQRSHSQEAGPIFAQRSASGDSQNSSMDASVGNKRKSTEVFRKVSPPSGPVTVKKTRTASGKSYGGLAEAVADDISRAHRRTSSGSKRILSAEKKVFMHPNDRIWEDPQEGETTSRSAAPFVSPQNVSASVPAQQQATHIMRKNPFARVRMQAEKLERSSSEPILETRKRPSVESLKNPPSQTRKPWYTANVALPPTPPSAADRNADEVSPKLTPTKEGMEVRGDDIRAATSKQRKDYSPKLPRPTVVSDKPGRPIVSFQPDWKPKEVMLEEMKTTPWPDVEAEPSKSSSAGAYGNRRTQWDDVPRDEVSKPPIPTINFRDGPSIPRIILPEEPDFAGPLVPQSAPVTPMISIEPPTIAVQPPSINISGPHESVPGPGSSSRHPHQPPARPLPHHAATSPLPKSTPHYTPSMRQSGALCAHCALPIAGRILSAGGERFHPECFVCHQCNTNLEHVAFYPEPENKRSERLNRIIARQNGQPISIPAGIAPEQIEVEDGDGTPRFYCHLDFHELFSPRCKSCKTPIEGEVIVACGAEWHIGHFFCAQCGDPFDATTPFVEKDGYAWCVGCHTNRYSAKCRKCRKPVTDTVVKALGFEWHEGCFVCTECNGEFEDGRYFLRGDSQNPVCVKCEERRLKA